MKPEAITKPIRITKSSIISIVIIKSLSKTSINYYNPSFNLILLVTISLYFKLLSLLIAKGTSISSLFNPP